jgi:hypothetical protein
VGNLFCEVRSALLSEITEKSNEMAEAARYLASTAGKRGEATTEDKALFAKLRTNLHALVQECQVLHDRMQEHRDEHGC